MMALPDPPLRFVQQDCEACNAGRGSNLTLDGVVECDASAIDDAGAFGAVAAVPGIVLSYAAAADQFVVLHSRSNPTTCGGTLISSPPRIEQRCCTCSAVHDLWCCCCAHQLIAGHPLLRCRGG